MTSAKPAPEGGLELRKRRAAEEAVTLVESGMIVGLGAGTTAAFAIPRLAELVSIGRLRDVACVPCAGDVERRARALGLHVVELTECPRVDLTIDGADEVDPQLNLIKGRGGALLHEKMVAQTSRREVIVVDEGKLSPRLGTHAHVPVEVFPFGWRDAALFLGGQGTEAILRMVGGQPFVTQEGNFILDCHFGPIEDPAALAALLDARACIAAHGLFLNLATDLFVGDDTGVRHLAAGGDILGAQDLRRRN